METREVAQQIKLGAFVLTGMGLLLAAVFLIGSENNVFSKTFKLSAEFKNVEGLKEGDNVWLSGVKIGTVSSVTIASEGKVIVTLSLKENQNRFIRRDATASIGADGLVGNKILIISPGKAGQSISANDTINTSSPPGTQELMNIAKDVGENTRSLTNDLSLIAKRINSGSGVVGELLNDGALAQEIRHAVTELSTTSTNTAQASRELHQLLFELRNGDGLVPALLTDTSYARRFDKTLSNLEKMSTNVASMSSNLQDVSAKLNNDQSAIGVLTSDENAAASLRNTMENAEKASQKLDENMEALQHNFLFRRYFRKQDKRKEREAASSKGE